MMGYGYRRVSGGHPQLVSRPRGVAQRELSVRVSHVVPGRLGVFLNSHRRFIPTSHILLSYADLTTLAA